MACLGVMTTTPCRYIYVFSIIDFLRRIYSEESNVPIMTEWYYRSREEPTTMRDIRDGLLFRKRFLRHYGDSKYNVAISISGDGVQKSGVSSKTVFPLMIRVESTCTTVKTDANLQSMVMLCPGNYTNIQLLLSAVAAELHALSKGVMINIAGAGLQKVRICTLLLGGDMRAVQSLAGKHRDPRYNDACPNCEIEGTRHVRSTIYMETKDSNPEYLPGDCTTNKFKTIPSLAYAIPDIEETIAICFAHNVKNMIVRIFAMHGNLGSVRFTDQKRRAERPGKFSDGGVPWACDTRAVMVLEHSILRAVWSRKTKSPFQFPDHISVKEHKAKELVHGLTDISTYNSRVHIYIIYKA